MLAFNRLSGEMVLVKSNKGDAYYAVTPKSLTVACQPHITRVRLGKHQRKYLPAAKPAKDELTGIRPRRQMAHGLNGPVDEAILGVA